MSPERRAPFHLSDLFILTSAFALHLCPAVYTRTLTHLTSRLSALFPHPIVLSRAGGFWAGVG